MGRRFPFPLLPPLQEGAPGLVRQIDPAALPEVETRLLEHPVVDQGENEAVRHAGAQILHQVQSQGVPAGAVPVEKAHVGVQPHALQRRGAIVGQQAVCEGQKGIDGVQGRLLRVLNANRSRLPITSWSNMPK